MATHDYIISNASGAAVRADLNNALAAIVSNNSNASSPSTTYAYQWWADTTTGQLKIRNAANSAWIVLMELDGTMLMEDGTVSAPGLAFASDLNTGFFRSAADKINFATGGVERLEIGSSEVVFNDGSNDVDFRVESNGNANMLFIDGGNDRVGIGTTSPSNILHCANTSGNAIIRVQSDASSVSSVYLGDSAVAFAGFLEYQNSSDVLRIGTNGAERMRIDSSGNLLVGTTTVGNSAADNLTIADSGSGGITIRTGTSSNGNLFFADGASGDSALDGFIQYQHSGRNLKFGTAATERMRIDSSGNVGIGTTSPNKTLEVKASANPIMRIGDGTRHFEILGGSATQTAGIGTAYSSSFTFNTNSTERMRIDSSGNLGINVSNPTSRLHINGTITVNNIGSGAGTNALKYNTSTGRITYDASSERYKNNIRNADKGLSEILQLLPRKFEYKDTGRTDFGFIAEEVVKVIPELVTLDGEGLPEAVNYDRFVSVLTAALQEAITKIETLEARVTTLEAG